MSEQLASYAVSESTSKGRVFAEEKHRYRNDFERDRDRVIHCSAFRRLEGKTQVFSPGRDDFYRTRLTHSIEVAQIGRTIAKALRVNEGLTEAICLAHDLGHAPFGHAGEHTLNELMKEHGGFEHNRQSLKIVDVLEHPYPKYAGLNLMYETRLGLAKHESPYDKPRVSEFGELNCSVEGQIADVADRIAYNCHDLEDGMRSGLIKREQLQDVEIYAETAKRIDADAMPDSLIRSTRTAKGIIDLLVSDCIENSSARLAEERVESVEQVYQCAESMVAISDASEEKLRKLEKFLLANLYMHGSVAEGVQRAAGWLGELWGRLRERPELMPGYYRRFIESQGVERTVCDYVAGMTDRYCLATLEKLRAE